MGEERFFGQDNGLRAGCMAQALLVVGVREGDTAYETQAPALCLHQTVGADC